jgi:tRNA A37 threonylcarbamoyladenosine dehydratase
LSRAVRVKLKKKGITSGFPVVFSTERTTRELLPLKEHQKDDPDKFRLLPNYRVRIIPVFSCMPAIMGQSIASYVLCDLAGQMFKYRSNKTLLIE